MKNKCVSIKFEISLLMLIILLISSLAHGSDHSGDYVADHKHPIFRLLILDQDMNATRQNPSLLGQKFVLCDDAYFLKELSPISQKISHILRLTYQEIDVDTLSSLQYCDQGEAFFRSKPFSSSALYSMYNIFECIGVVLDNLTSHSYGLMHVDLDSFMNGRFNRLLDKFPAHARSEKKVIIFSSYYSALLDLVYVSLVNKGFKIDAADVSPMIFRDHTKYARYSDFNGGYEKLRKCTGVPQLKKYVQKLPFPACKSIVYDFFTHQSHLYFTKPEESFLNSQLIEDLRFSTLAKSLHSS